MQFNGQQRETFAYALIGFAMSHVKFSWEKDPEISQMSILHLYSIWTQTFSSNLPFCTSTLFMDFCLVRFWFFLFVYCWVLWFSHWFVACKEPYHENFLAGGCSVLGLQISQLFVVTNQFLSSVLQSLVVKVHITYNLCFFPRCAVWTSQQHLLKICRYCAAWVNGFHTKSQKTISKWPN